MSGLRKMYQMREIVRHDLPVEIPKCMYNLKNIHSRNGVLDGTVGHVSTENKKLDTFDQNNHKIPGMAELNAKQDDILKQLADLKKQILNFKSDLKISITPCAKPVANGTLLNILIKANPSNPPYSLGAIKEILGNYVALTFSTHTHSSVTSLERGALELNNTLKNYVPKSNGPKMIITVIWNTNISDTELWVSNFPILGEVNVLRYLSKSMKSPLNYDSESDSFEIDSLLDVCYLLVREKVKAKRAQLIQIITKSLRNGHFLLGKSQGSIADLAAFSALKQVCCSFDMNVNLCKWLYRCEVGSLGY